MNQLSESGVICEIKNKKECIKIQALCCCVDSKARNFSQGLKECTGYCSCSWCRHPGLPIMHKTKKVVKFPMISEKYDLRTELNALEDIQKHDATGKTSFGFTTLKLPEIVKLNGFNFISGYVPDSRHCIALGVIRQFTRYWFSVKCKEYSIPRESQNKINEILSSIKAPHKCGRLTRSLKNLKFYKSKELENWGLYYSLPCLSIVPNFEEYLEHWSWFVNAFYLLMQDQCRRKILQKQMNY